MVAVAQLVECRIVAPVVVGSIPISHPNYNKARDVKFSPGFVFSANVIKTPFSGFIS